MRRYLPGNASTLDDPAHRVRMDCDLSCATAPPESFVSEARRALLARDEQPFLELRVKGFIPMAPAGLNYGALPARATACVNRYVTTPRRPNRPVLKRFAASPAPALALHLRTGFADVDDATHRLVPPDRAATARWVRAACGPSPFSDGKQRYILSDSQGLVRHLTDMHGHLVANHARRQTSTRSWRVPLGPKAAAYDDLVVAGMATELQVAPQQVLVHWRPGQTEQRLGTTRVQHSGFFRAVSARSVCIRSLRPVVTDCPHFAEVFPRDLLLNLELAGNASMLPFNRSAVRARRPRRYEALRSRLRPRQPCSRLASAVDCGIAAVSALKFRT